MAGHSVPLAAGRGAGSSSEIFGIGCSPDWPASSTPLYLFPSFLSPSTIIHKVPPGGTCMFHALAVYLRTICNWNISGAKLRKDVADAVSNRRPERIAGLRLGQVIYNDTLGTLGRGLSVSEYAEYIKQPHTWAGNLDQNILSEVYNLRIHVFQRDTNGVPDTRVSDPACERGRHHCRYSHNLQRA